MSPTTTHQNPAVAAQDGEAEFAAEALVPAPPGTIFAFLSDLENHWPIAGVPTVMLGSGALR